MSIRLCSLVEHGRLYLYLTGEGLSDARYFLVLDTVFVDGPSHALLHW